MPDANCNQNRDPLKLVREGTSQAQRPFPALDPAFAPVDGRTMAHGMVFAQALSAFLKYYELTNVPVDSWQRFFGQDVSLQLAVAAIQDVDEYRQQVKEYFDFLDEILHSDASFEIDCRKITCLPMNDLWRNYRINVKDGVRIRADILVLIRHTRLYPYEFKIYPTLYVAYGTIYDREKYLEWIANKNCCIIL